jgi:hypothetical protein
MYSIDSAGNVGNQWSNGNPAIPTAGTILDATWMNMLQAELLNILSVGGVAPVKGTNTQVLTALQAIFNKTPTPSAPSYAGAGLTWQAPGAGYLPLGAYRELNGRFHVEGLCNPASGNPQSIAANTPTTIGTFGIAPSTTLYGTCSVQPSGGTGPVILAYIDTGGVLHIESPAAITIGGLQLCGFQIHGVA